MADITIPPGETGGQAPPWPDAYDRYMRAVHPEIDAGTAPNEISGRWKHMTSPRERRFWTQVDAALTGGDRIVLEALCRRDGVPLESSVTPGEPARNYELADRLGIGRVFGLRDA